MTRTSSESSSGSSYRCCVKRGKRGHRGKKGKPGKSIHGPQGLPGEIGPQGIPGEICPHGLTGEIGPQGLPGEIGPQGLPGEIGSQGLPGEIGIPGKDAESITNNNFVWAIKTDQQFAILEDIFINILYTSNPEITGWTYNNGIFTCNQTGKYTVSYSVTMSSIGSSKTASIRGVINSTEIIGSAVTQNFQSTSINQVFVNFFIMSISEGDTFSLQFAGNTADKVFIETAEAIDGETPITSSLIITRIV